MEDNQSATQVAAAVLARLEPILQKERPDWVLVQGTRPPWPQPPWRPSTPASRWGKWRPAYAPTTNGVPSPRLALSGGAVLHIPVLRHFTVYGPAGRPDMSLFRFVQWISEGRPVIVYGDGK